MNLNDHEEIEHIGLNKHKSKAYLLNGSTGTNAVFALKVYATNFGLIEKLEWLFLL